MKHFLYVPLFAILALAPALNAQPDTLWTKTFGGSGWDAAFSVQQTSDGGFIVAGRCASFGAGNYDAYLVKTDTAGVEQWSQTYGGTGGDFSNCVQQTSDGGYITTGWTDSFGAGWDDLYIVKADAAGTEQWSQTFGGSDFEYGESVFQTTDGGYIVAGHTASYGAGNGDVYLIKTDESGLHQWSHTFGGTAGDFGYDADATADGGVIITGVTESFGAGGGDMYLIKTDAAGSEEWSRTYGGSGDETGRSVQQTADGGYIIAGHADSYGAPGYDVYLVKTDASGTEQWSQTFGGSENDFGRCVKQTSDGGYIITGWTDSFGTGIWSVYLIKTDDAGIEQWSQTFSGGGYEYSRCIQELTDGGYIVAGSTTSYGAGSHDFWLMRLDSDSNGISGHHLSPQPGSPHLSAYPNPFNPTTVLSYKIQVASNVYLAVYNIAGKEVVRLADGWQKAGMHELTFDGTALASGMYIYRLTAGDFTGVGKMVLMK